MRQIAGALFALIIPLLAVAGCGPAGNAGTSPSPSEAETASSSPSPTPIVDAGISEHSPTGEKTSVISEDEPEVLTCENVRKARSPGLCGVLEKAPRADMGLASTKRAIEVWRKMEGPFAALSGRETALTVLSADARMGDGDAAGPLPPAAFICPGAPPTVYVPDTLLTLIAKRSGEKNKYPEDFLAFVLGHELAHRMNDLTPDGCQLAAFQRPGKGLREEELADSRSAFFMTNVGYSASKIADGDLVSRFLEAEFELGRDDSKGRRNSLLAALSSFDGYEALYQTGLMTAMTGEMEAADRLLSWSDELLSQRGVPLPEVRVIRAVTRINRAAKMAPWTAKLALPVGIEPLRCTPLHPGHSGLWEKPAKRVRAPDIEMGRRLLKEALQLLNEAEARGATKFTVAAARACAMLYLGDAAGARDAQLLAESLAPKRAPTAVRDALAGNRQLVDFLSHVDRNPVPDDDESDAYRTWASAISKALGGRKASPDLVAVLQALQDPSREAPAAVVDAPVCSSPTAPTPSPLAPLAKMDGDHGQCPAGFRLTQRLPSADAAANTGSQNGVTQCKANDESSELLRVRLVANTDPPYDELDRTLRIAPPPPHLEDLDAWACSCSSLTQQGVSDEGEVVYRARCATLGVSRGALITEAGKIRRVIQHSR